MTNNKERSVEAARFAKKYDLDSKSMGEIKASIANSGVWSVEHMRENGLKEDLVKATTMMFLVGLSFRDVNSAVNRLERESELSLG